MAVGCLKEPSSLSGGFPDFRADTRTLLATLLQDEGYTVLTAPNGRAAVRVLETILPDAIISDVMMPHMNGAELWQWVQTNPATASTPVILWSAAVTMAIRAACPTAVIVTKPCDWDLLLGQVAALVQAGGEAPAGTGPA